MSTRANIVIKNKSNDGKSLTSVKYVQVYHHCDGYPKGVGEEIRELLHKRFVEEQNKDISVDSLYKMLIETNTDEMCPEYRLDTATNDIWKVRLHGDIEYLYVIDIDEESVFCYHQNIGWSSEDENAHFATIVTDYHQERYPILYRMSFFTDESIEDAIHEMQEINNKNNNH